MGCPIKTSKEFQLLLNQLGSEEAAIYTWKVYNENYPESLMATSDLKSALGFKNKLSSLAKNLLAKRVAAYNQKNNTSHHFVASKIGESDLYSIELKINYLPKKQALRQEELFDQNPNWERPSSDVRNLNNEGLTPDKVRPVGFYKTDFALQEQEIKNLFTEGEEIEVEQIPQGIPVKEGVSELFEENPDFSSQIYEALGFKSNLKTSLGKELEYKDTYVSTNRLKDFKQYQVLDEKGNDIGSVVIEYRGSKNVILHPKLKIEGKGYGKDLYKFVSNKFNVEIQEWNEGAIANSSAAKKMWDSLEKEGTAKRIIDEEQGDNFRVLNYRQEITPQQKQQAQQVYSQYLSTIFPDSKVKDIVYHGITNRLKEKFDKFSKEFIKSGQGRYGEDGFFFSENKEEVNKNYNNSGLITAIINLRNASGDIYKNTWKETVEYLTEPQKIYGGKTDLDYLSEGYRATAWYKEGNWKKQIERLKEDGWKIEETSNSYIKLGKISSQEKTYYNHLKKNLEKGTLPFNVNNSVEAIREAKEQGLDGLIYENVLEESSIDKHNQYVVFEPEQIHILSSKSDIQGFKDFVQGKQFQKLTAEEKSKTIEQVTKEHRSIAALKDLSAKLAHRIGSKVEFENRTDADWKGYNQGNTSVLNEAYMTPDTPFHEILAHPIIRAIKNKEKFNLQNTDLKIINGKFFINKKEVTKEEYFDFYKKGEQALKENNFKYSKLYNSLLKELETGRGKAVFEQVKRDYKFEQNYIKYYEDKKGLFNKSIEYVILDGVDVKNQKEVGRFKTIEEANEFIEKYAEQNYNVTSKQQEEAIVTLLGLMAADKLDAKKDATLISKLKELWKQISDFVKSLLKQDGIKIDELPITTTLNDLAEIMAYGNNKIILPGYKVEYSTPLGNKYETLEEVNNEIRGLADANTEIDLSGVKLDFNKNNNPYNLIPDKPYYTSDSNFLVFVNSDKINHYRDFPEYKNLEKENYYEYKFIPSKYTSEFVKVTTTRVQQLVDHNPGLYIGAIDELKGADLDKIGIRNFIEKNKEYEQSKEIIEQWKKENNIQYDPEEVYSRGQGFYSSIGAYSNLELDLLLKNLIQHIEDNKKASEQEEFHLYRVQEKGFNINENTLQALENKKNRGETLKWFQTNLLNDPEKRAMLESRDKHYGQWFTDTVEGLQYYLDDKEDIEILRIKVSKKDLKRFNVGNLDSEDAKKWSLRHHDEYIIPKEIISKAEKFERDDLEKLKKQHLTNNNYGFTISAFTKPIDKRLKHIEGTGDRVRFVIYPKSEHIKWAAPTDVYSGSVWDAHEKVSKDKKSELLGVSFTKAPSLRNINEVSPNLADIIDNLSHAHNELGVELTTNNFELEADESVSYETRKLIESVNKILQQKRLQEIDNFISTLEKQCE